jgi:LPXTG-motif cell wall-anchored protein
MFALITPDEIDATWVSTVVPHELTHLVFDTAVKNPYHFPPRWLNEGLAVYLSEGYTDAWRGAVTSAVKSDDIIPLDGLAGQFPTTRDQFFLAYGESVSAVDYLVRTSGKDALVKLVRSYADGVTDDEAFTTGVGQDVASFQAAWLADLGAKAPSAVGPQPGPAGPLPAGWAAEPGVPGATGAPVASGRPSQPASSGAPTGDAGPLVPVLAALGLALLVGGGVLVLRSRRRPPGVTS